MPLDVINTDIGAMGALQSPAVTQPQPEVTRKQISTGYPVANLPNEGPADSASATHTTFMSIVTSFSGTKPAAAMVANIIADGRINTVVNDLHTAGTSINAVNTQTTCNGNEVDALSIGLGSLDDADLAKESAQLIALQIRQQLGMHTPSLANHVPKSLLSLFK